MALILIPLALVGDSQTFAQGPPSSSADEPEAAVIKGQKVGSTDVEALRSVLAPYGWEVKRDIGGDLLLIPRPAQAEAPKPKGFTPQHIQALRTLLAPHGWRIEPDGEGGVLLFPGAAAAPPPSVGMGASDTGKPTPPMGTVRAPGFQLSDVERLRSVLSHHGWRIEPDGHGGVLLFPHAASTRPPMAAGKIALPVDTWQEARELTEHWVRASGEQGLMPGKIRKVNRIYVSSVVSDTPPHVLRHQLVIRQDDGRVFLIY